MFVLPDQFFRYKIQCFCAWFKRTFVSRHRLSQLVISAIKLFEDIPLYPSKIKIKTFWHALVAKLSHLTITSYLPNYMVSVEDRCKAQTVLDLAPFFLQSKSEYHSFLYTWSSQFNKMLCTECSVLKDEGQLLKCFLGTWTYVIQSYCCILSPH